MLLVYCKMLKCASLTIMILQRYISIPAEIPDPKANKVCLFTAYLDHF